MNSKSIDLLAAEAFPGLHYPMSYLREEIPALVSQMVHFYGETRSKMSVTQAYEAGYLPLAAAFPMLIKVRNNAANISFMRALTVLCFLPELIETNCHTPYIYTEEDIYLLEDACLYLSVLNNRMVKNLTTAKLGLL